MTEQQQESPDPGGNGTPIYNDVAADNPGAAQQMDDAAAATPAPDDPSAITDPGV